MSSYFPRSIPRIIHQTWKTHPVPPDKGDTGSWQRLNPDWDYRFWDDAALRQFMAAEFPDLLPLFDGYSRPVQRADLARYCLLKRFGGVYTDIDTRCLAPLAPLAEDTRIILCEEPPERHHHAQRRGLPTLFFNGVMASPAGHPFWDKVIDLCVRMYPRKNGDVLETTGPLLLTAAVLQWPDQDAFRLHSSHLFAEREGTPTGNRHGHWQNTAFCEHFWNGSWFREKRPNAMRRSVTALRKLRHAMSGRKLLLSDARQRIDAPLLLRPLADGQELPETTILVPVRNGAATLQRNIEQILNLDYPKQRLHLVYGQGDSTDNTSSIIADLTARYAETFASLTSVRTDRNAPHLAHSRRWRQAYQFRRRAGLARARNDLLQQAMGLTSASSWFLWLDSDVIGLPSNLLQSLLAARSKIVTPDCVLAMDGPSYDLNAFLDVGEPNDCEYYRHLHGGILQPPPHYWVRRHLHDLRYLEQVPLNGVGGTVLLVHSDVHRSGLIFPEIPYRDLLETEGFGQLARDLGVTPVGLPQLKAIHDAS
ncbi:glycosyltransferase [Rhizobium sp. CSW-27]|uniref:glycosyltransferase n=1 Tax=Rhizobium sp. CSW-27 TaxID=2839985 RepID=UPI001C01ACB9|nr:glycosyltransferase [Rhizobium sp. CSW-27]MBT9369617.1 glycosyltransferase [Rhizobium sp. CSW-27]